MRKFLKELFSGPSAIELQYKYIDTLVSLAEEAKKEQLKSKRIKELERVLTYFIACRRATTKGWVITASNKPSLNKAYGMAAKLIDNGKR